MDQQGRTNVAANRAELDEAFRRWLEARVAASGPDASEGALNYLVPPPCMPRVRTTEIDRER